MSTSSKVMGILAICIVLLSIFLFGALMMISDQELAKLNPFVEEKTSYVRVESLSTDTAVGLHTAAQYTLPVWKEDRNMNETTFLGTKLREGAYLKLTEKKGYLISYEEVQPEDIPEEIRIHLEES
ncbi:YxeA family protein [Paenibacillus terreus]|uniref:YxeA family protein n=1 Tax=Paenibacillus terreus TaxID=1387834 RepID=A0ABV5BCI3_9BACL